MHAELEYTLSSFTGMIDVAQIFGLIAQQNSHECFLKIKKDMTVTFSMQVST